MRGEKSRSLVGYVLLLLAFLGAILTISTLSIGYGGRGQTQGYKEAVCENDLSYFKPSSLYNVEKRSNSPRAVAYDVILSDSLMARVLFDYSSSISGADIKTTVTNTMDREIEINGASFNISVSGVSKSQPLDSLKLKPGESRFVEATIDLSTASMDELRTDFSLTSSTCLVHIPQFINLRRQDKQDGFVPNIINNDEKRLQSLSPGINYLGFSDLRLTSNLESQNVDVYSYNGTRKNWEKSSSIEPGIGYIAYSSRSKKNDVTFANPFWIEQSNQLRSVGPGWNLMYNNFGKDVSFSEYTVSFFQGENRAGFYDSSPSTIDDLIKRRLVSDKVYTAEKNGFKELGSAIVPDAAVFWVYVYTMPLKTELKSNGLDFKLEGVGDTYKSGQNINFNFMVVNLDSGSHEVVASGINDPCSYGIKVSDLSGKVIYNDFASRVCPLWPATTTLQSKGKINYNYTWRVPKSISGKYKVEAYFDNFRGVLGDPVKKESLINIE